MINSFQIDGESGEELTANLLLKRAIRLSKWLTQIGVGIGDNISINSENRLEFCIVPVATLFSGGTFAPLNPEYTPRKFYIYIIKTIFCQSYNNIHFFLIIQPS